MNAGDLPPGILDLLQKLQAMTTSGGCTPSEAAAAAERIRAILDKYQLSIADIPARKVGESIIEYIVETGHSRIPSAAKQYAANIAYAWRCRVMSTYFQIYFVGHESDAKCAAFFFETTYVRVRARGKAVAKRRGYRGQQVKDFADTFTMEAGMAVMHRMKDFGGDGQMHALVSLKNQLVEEFIDSKWPGVKVKQAEYHAGDDARALGRQFGETLPIDPGLEAGQAPAPALAGKGGLFDG